MIILYLLPSSSLTSNLEGYTTDPSDDTAIQPGVKFLKPCNQLTQADKRSDYKYNVLSCRKKVVLLLCIHWLLAIPLGDTGTESNIHQ